MIVVPKQPISIVTVKVNNCPTVRMVSVDKSELIVDFEKQAGVAIIWIRNCMGTLLRAVVFEQLSKSSTIRATA